MKSLIPSNAREAGARLCGSLKAVLPAMPDRKFRLAWFAVAYLYPELHPDGYEDADSGWPHGLRRYAAEAWRRADAGELSDEDLYPADAAWAGICDRLRCPTDQEAGRREALRTSKV